MSVYSNNQVFKPIEYPWKVFVKGSADHNNTNNPKNSNLSEPLSFQGNEARKTYEEILSKEAKNNPKVKQDPERNLTKSNSVTSCGKSNKSNKKVNVTVNSILKAIEERDIKFLKCYVCPENVNMSDDYGWTPLMLAAYCGCLEIVELLLKSGANKKTREKSGLTAAQLALKKNYLDIVALLRKKDSVVTDDSKLRNIPDQEHLTVNSTDCSIVKKVSEKLIKETEIYCDVCEGKFFQSTSQRHENSIVHIFNSKPKFPNAFFGISKINKGYQMLLSTGWDEESGLGPSGKGLKYPVKTILKVDRKGLGQTSTKNEARITHFKPGDINAVKSMRISKPKVVNKKDREKLLNRESRKDRAIRLALS